MANKYFKNFIMCGEIDYYCLLCKEHFELLVEVEKHIRWETHRKSVKAQIRNNKFKRDVVYKIEEKFYCEVCNYIAPEINAMIDHVGGDIHKRNKEKPKTEDQVPSTVCVRELDFILVKDVILEDRDWHAIVNRFCSICNIRMNNPSEHINSSQHVLNLIENKIIVENNDVSYRKVCNNSFFCFICKGVVPLLDLESHWSGEEHSVKKQSCLYRATLTASYSADKKIELAKKLINTQKDYFHIFTEKNVAICKQCESTVELEFMTMLNHQKGHKDNANRSEQTTSVITVECPSSEDEAPDEVVYCEVQDQGKRRAALSKFGKEHFLKLHPGGARGYCSLCHANISAHMTIFKEHIRGRRHKAHLELMGIRKSKDHKIPDSRFKPLQEFINNIFYAEAVGVLWVNKKFCLDFKSFIMVSDLKKNRKVEQTKCFVCNVFYPSKQHLEHFTIADHKRKFFGAKVLSLKDEFVREISPDLYHCGFCNKVFPFWEVMEKHLAHWKHAQRKNDKDLVIRLAKEWFDEKMLIKTSGNPDILFIQLIRTGMFFQ